MVASSGCVEDASTIKVSATKFNTNGAMLGLYFSLLYWSRQPSNSSICILSLMLLLIDSEELASLLQLVTWRTKLSILLNG
ncbi:hypothetical protein IHE45_14G001900 [Dioscorea alata]|uniref:Uncharacterized protein n=1 Tax=Dioscorea alata TaxID=55571 RepID=A0ACB7UPK3_DIOAL|nr:hypothetical protein IHE45_14G001900 [Dioscorea alata]